MPQMVRVSTNDGEEQEVDIEIAKMWGTVRHLLEDIDDVSDTIPLANVSAPILKTVIRWCELHLENPEASPNEPDDDFARRSRLCRPVPAPDKAIFKDVNMPVLFELLVSLNYLNMPLMLSTVTTEIACRIIDGTPESVKAEFGITEDFSMDEKIATLKAYPFLRKGCDDIPEMKEANELLSRQEQEEAKRGAAAASS